MGVPATAGQRLAATVESLAVARIPRNELVAFIYTPAVLLSVQVAAAEVAAAGLQQLKRLCIRLTCSPLLSDQLALMS